MPEVISLSRGRPIRHTARNDPRHRRGRSGDVAEPFPLPRTRTEREPGGGEGVATGVEGGGGGGLGDGVTRRSLSRASTRTRYARAKMHSA